jgi:hypothetical protein
MLAYLQYRVGCESRLRMIEFPPKHGHENGWGMRVPLLNLVPHFFLQPRTHANIGLMTLPKTSVNRKSRPAWRNVSFS